AARCWPPISAGEGAVLVCAREMSVEYRPRYRPKRRIGRRFFRNLRGLPRGKIGQIAHSNVILGSAKAVTKVSSVAIRKFVSPGNSRHCERSEAIQCVWCETLSGLLRCPSGASQ